MSTCGNSGTDEPLPDACPDTVTVRCSLIVVNRGDALPDTDPGERQAFARQFRRRSGLE